MNPKPQEDVLRNDALELLELTSKEAGSIFGVRVLECPYMPERTGVMLDSRGNFVIFRAQD